MLAGGIIKSSSGYSPGTNDVELDGEESPEDNDMLLRRGTKVSGKDSEDESTALDLCTVQTSSGWPILVLAVEGLKRKQLSAGWTEKANNARNGYPTIKSTPDTWASNAQSGEQAAPTNLPSSCWTGIVNEIKRPCWPLPNLHQMRSENSQESEQVSIARQATSLYAQ